MFCESSLERTTIKFSLGIKNQSQLKLSFMLLLVAPWQSFQSRGLSFAVLCALCLGNSRNHCNSWKRHKYRLDVHSEMKKGGRCSAVCNLGEHSDVLGADLIFLALNLAKLGFSAENRAAEGRAPPAGRGGERPAPPPLLRGHGAGR